MLNRYAMIMVTSLLMFPQISETMYSPTLPSISEHFLVTAQDAAQTLSVYFIGFAIGVLFWGRISDVYGRKPALLAGLGIYMSGCILALLVRDFSMLLVARVFTAFGAATGSVVTQTILRDCFREHELTRIFSIISIALAISPAVGVFSGGILTSLWGYWGVFIGLAVLAILMLAGSFVIIPETLPDRRSNISISAVIQRMVRDKKIWLAVILVGCFNISLFSYYSLAPFIFARLDLNAKTFGYSGIALAAGSLIGSNFSRWLHNNGTRKEWTLTFALFLNVLGSIGVLCAGISLVLLIPMALVAMSFTMAIPVLLGSALSGYAECRGTAGALFGLCYYVIIALGLLLSGWVQELGLALMVSSIISGIAIWLYLPQLD
ncbi:multidrug effflux MFS transporter [Enterobacter asburiae]